MKIITYNVNGLRAALKKGLEEWLEKENPDVLCLQEIKLQDDQFPASLFQNMGYHCYIHAAEKKGYSGVALFSKQQPDNVVKGINNPKYDREGRYIRADFGEITVASIYHPSGTSGEARQGFKMEWLSDFSDFATQLAQERPKLVLCGDYNICHEAIDIHDPVRNAKVSGFLPEEREWFTRFLKKGFIDAYRHSHPQEQCYTWWSYRFKARERNKGWRIDYCLLTEVLLPQLREAFILSDAVHSDHCPTGIIIE